MNNSKLFNELINRKNNLEAVLLAEQLSSRVVWELEQKLELVKVDLKVMQNTSGGVAL
ncbi:MAG: hypothetical protein ABIF10_05550 [Candidatus Woesearchaeota archaeon]